jgi:hypothetical protein
MLRKSWRVVMKWLILCKEVPGTVTPTDFF